MLSVLRCATLDWWSHNWVIFEIILFDVQVSVNLWCFWLTWNQHFGLDPHHLCPIPWFLPAGPDASPWLAHRSHRAGAGFGDQGGEHGAVRPEPHLVTGPHWPTWTHAGEWCHQKQKVTLRHMTPVTHLILSYSLSLSLSFSLLIRYTGILILERCSTNGCKKEKNYGGFQLLSICLWPPFLRDTVI